MLQNGGGSVHSSRNFPDTKQVYCLLDLSPLCDVNVFRSGGTIVLVYHSY